MARLLEQAGAAGLGLAELLRRLAIRVGEQLSGLGPRRVHDLRALALALRPVALDLALALGQVGLLAPNLLLGPAELRRRGALGVALEDVGELGRLADQVQGVHADGVAGRVDLRALPCGLEHAQLRLQLDDVPAESLECVLHALLVVPIRADREILDPRKRGDRGLCALFLGHGFLSGSPRDAKTCRKYADSIGGFRPRP